jgi:protein-disulfide isomerase/uncharacterized membrane protein
MSPKLKLLPLLLVPFPALAADGGSGTLVVGGAAVAVVILAALVAMPATRKVGASAAALFGILVAGYLTVQHNSPSASVCNISGTFNCDLVNRSSYSEVGGVSIALFGVAFYAVMAWLGIRHASGGAIKAPAVMTALSAIAVVYDIYLAWASSQLGAWCPLCMVSWAVNVVLLGASVLLWRAMGRPSLNGVFQGLSAEAGGVAVVGLLTLVAGGVASRGDSSPAISAGAAAGSVEELSAYYEQTTGRIELDGTEPAIGPADARFTIVEWADYECPHCAMMADELKKVLADNPDVRILFKHYPISGACNQFVQGERHQFACNAAAAAECARLQGKFWELNAQMFKNQEFLGKEDIRFMAQQLQLDMPAFEACMAEPATAEAVRQDVTAGGVAGVEGTPSVFVNGLFPDQWVRVNGGREAINGLLSAARAGKTLPAPKPHPEHEGH